MWIKLAPYVFIVLLVVAGVWRYVSMENKIEYLQGVVANQELAISATNDTIKVIEQIAEKEKEIAVMEAVAKTKKQFIEEGILRDESNSVDINSTHYYIVK